MMTSLPLLVFTDLDGTLLSHDTYEWGAARPALDALTRVGAGVVLASSKTAAEIVPLRLAMGLGRWSAIVENGSGVLGPGDGTDAGSADYTALRDILKGLDPELRAGFRGFGDMSIKDVVTATGLPPDDAARAKMRSFSEPGLWSHSNETKARFIEALNAHGVSGREGGRFLTLSFGHTKADRMEELISQHHPQHTLALGDAPNDVEMLETAEYGVIVANPHHARLPALANETTGQIIRTSKPGPEGWNDAVLNLLQKLHLD